MCVNSSQRVHVVPFLPVDIEDLDNVGELLYEPGKVPRLDEEVIGRREVESLGCSRGGEVDLRRTAASVPHQVLCRAPVEGLEFPLKICQLFTFLSEFPKSILSSSLFNVLSCVNNSPGGGSGGEMLQLFGQVGLVLLLLVKPDSGLHVGGR